MKTVRLCLMELDDTIEIKDSELVAGITNTSNHELSNKYTVAIVDTYPEIEEPF